MQRLLMNSLIEWKNKKNRQPLILKGARQVGKTWLLNEFGRRAFDDVLYINFENAPGLRKEFDGDISPKRILDILEGENASIFTNCFIYMVGGYGFEPQTLSV